ncbi:Inner membrane protein YhaH [compost metagenome]
MDWYLKVLKNYVGFEGRARRTEYWMFILFNFIVSIVLSIVGALVGLDSILAYVYAAAVLLPSLAVAVRRLHDTGRSGWMILLSLIPFIGSIILIVFMCQDSEPGENQYGPNPKI